MNNIQIIRLHSGEDVIATVVEHENESVVTLENPMTLFFKRLPTGRSMMVMTPWIPMELVENNSATIHVEEMIAVFEPKHALVEYYSKTLENIYARMTETEQEIENSLLSEEDDFISDDIEETVEEVINNILDKKTLH